MLEKHELRKIMLEKRKGLSEEQVKASSQLISERLVSLPAFTQSGMILSYMAFGNEVDLRPVHEWILAHGKQLCLPRVLNGSEMDAAQVFGVDEVLVRSRFGILEPSRTLESVAANRIDLVLVPGVAFDRTGNRLGHGNGYYDRFLDQCGKDTITIGVAFDFQVLESIPAEPHDKRLSAILTESGVYMSRD